VAARSGWTLDRPSVDRTLGEWKAREHPDANLIRRLWDWVLDLLNDPTHRGREDPDQPGAFYGRIPETNVGVTFVLDFDERVVHVVIIATLGR
jgi:hypothetical protein